MDPLFQCPGVLTLLIAFMEMGTLRVKIKNLYNIDLRNWNRRCQNYREILIP
jgi:hypothetical protein